MNSNNFFYHSEDHSINFYCEFIRRRRGIRTQFISLWAGENDPWQWPHMNCKSLRTKRVLRKKILYVNDYGFSVCAVCWFIPVKSTIYMGHHHQKKKNVFWSEWVLKPGPSNHWFLGLSIRMVRSRYQVLSFS